MKSIVGKPSADNIPSDFRDGHSYDASREKAYREAAEMFLSNGDPASAKIIFDAMARHGSTEYVVVGAEGYGRACLAMHDTSGAIKSFEFALKYAAENLSYSEADPKPALIQNIEKLLRQARHQADIDRYGRDWVLFRDAESLRRSNHEFRKAGEIYTQLITEFPKSAYSDAARMYKCFCLIGLNKIPEATTALRSFIADNPDSLYCGEAMLELGRIAMEQRLDAGLAEKWFTSLGEWINDARQQPKARDLSINPESRQVSRPPQEMRQLDAWKNVVRSAIKPGQLVNQVTCPWYLDSLESQCVKFRVFLFLLHGKKDAALACLERLPQIEPEIKPSEQADVWTDYRRLKWAVKHGYFYARPEELKLYDERQKSVVLIGDLYYCTERFEKGAMIFRRLLKGEFGKLSSQQEDYLHFAIGSCVFRSRWAAKDYDGATAGALAEFQKVLAIPNGTLTEYRAAMAYSNLARQSPDPAAQEKGKSILLQLVRAPVNNEFTYTARITYARDQIKAGDQHGWETLRNFPKSAGDYYDLAQAVLQQCLQAERAQEQRKER